MEEEIGRITHFFSHLNVGIILVTHGTVQAGDKLHFKGHTTDFYETVESMQKEHAAVSQAAKGESVGVKVKEPVREHDLVFKIISDS